MHKINSILLLLILLIFTSCKDKSVSIESPDKKTRINIMVDREKQLIYQVEYLDSLVILDSDLGFELSGGKSLGRNVRIGSVEYSNSDEIWEPVYGERSEYPDKYKQATINIIGIESGIKELEIHTRAYDEGIAFRYFIPGEGELHILSENTQFSVPEDASFWVSYRAQRMIMEQRLDEITDECDRPVLVRINNHAFLAIGEAALVDFARMRLLPDPSGKHALNAALSSEVVENGGILSPWRFVMVAKEPARLLENNFLLLNLNDPLKIEDTSWIRPGKIIREVTLTTQGGIACIDFAEKHGLQFVEYDAGWYGDQYDEATDATTITIDPKRSNGTLDLQKVIDYGKEKGIGIILYVNEKALINQLDEILPVYRSWGVAGIKYGFVSVGTQEATTWLHEAVRKTAEYQLMVDIHDEYRPTGYSRTYPNLMTQEGIRGDEESPMNEMVINTLFTRMIAGAGDQTNCYFAARVDDKMGSHASQMAKAICIYSPWQFLYWYDRPKGSPGQKGGAGGSEQFIPEIPDLDFFAGLPTVWDDTRVLDGYPGKHALIARRNGDLWYVGALNGSEQRQFTIELDFLDAGKSYEAMIYTDDKSLKTRTNVSMRKIIVDRNSVISKNVLGQNGMAIVISEVQE